jgi:CRP-like cAMP-binding protein
MTEYLDVRLAAILSNPLLSGLPERTLGALSRSLVRKTARAGAHIFHKGDQPAGWYGILVGEVKIVTASESGDEIVLTQLAPGDWFGEVALLAASPNSHDAIARVDCEFALAPATAFRQLLTQEPQLYERLVVLLAQRVRTLIDVIEDFTSLPMAARLAKRVLAVVDTHGVGSVARRGRISQEEYALLVGARRQTVNRELRTWERAGWIRIEYGGIDVLDREALRQVVAAAASGCERTLGARPAQPPDS